MEEVRQLVQEEGREARNLVAFHVAVETPSRTLRKPPRGVPPPRRSTPRPPTRLRSASAGRDKRSELRARYWALLFGDLQRAIGEIYNTVEAHENLNECQEVILVLENYTRDFKALGEWFRLKWEYDNTPPPQRPQSLAWEIRKTDFVRPESRKAHSVRSSPSVSGKNSPCLSGHNTPSGKNSPNLTGKASPASGKISPRVTSNTTSPKANIEFFSTKIASKTATKPEPKSAKDVTRLSDIKEKEATRLSDIKEKEAKDVSEALEVGKEANVATENKENVPIKSPVVELGTAKECPNTSPKMVVIKSPKRTVLPLEESRITNEEISSQAKATISQLDAMENEFLAKNLTQSATKNDNQLNLDKEAETTINSISIDVAQKTDEQMVVSDGKESDVTASPGKSEENFGDVSNESSYKSCDEKSIVNEELPIGDIKLSPGNTNQDSIKNTDEKFDTPVQDIKKDELINGPKPIQSKDSADKETKKDSENEIKKDELKKAEPKPAEKPIRPAYSQAAAKPKLVTATKPEVKTPTRLIARSKTVAEIRSNSAPKPQRQFPKRNQTSKCSYPFNLTTGRTSLFDGPANKTVSKKPVNRTQGCVGDNKNNNKIDLKKPPLRPSTLKLNDKGDKKEKSNLTLENIKDCEEYGSSDTIVTQIDMSRIESSESLKTLVPEDMEIGNSIEVLNVDNTKSDNDGWLTVKSRRLSRESKKQSKSHWANRFHQPSATTSLPTLNMLESPRQETKELITSTNADRAKSEQPQNKPEPQPKPEVPKPKPEKDSKKDLSIIRQKSDVTGLKTRSSRSKALKREKVKDTPKNKGSELTKNRLHSSLESLTTGLARSQESTQDTFDFDKWKAEFKSTFKFLDEDDQMPNHNEILKSADPSEMSEIAEMTSQIEENERKISLALDFQSEVDQRKLCEEEDLLNRQIMELQQVSDIDLDTETDDTETDAEIPCEDTSACACTNNSDRLTSLSASLEHQYETALAGMSWAERVDTLGALEALVARDPGRAQQLHAKLSQGMKRRGSLQDALRRLQAKQARAERQRTQLRDQRAGRIHALLARVEEVKVAKNQLIEEKRLRMERRLQKAAENRDQHLKDIVRKAHDEEEKLREIAFIKQLEAENRRHEFLEQCRTHTSRLRLMRRDRMSKLEQKAAREAAVGARRQALEAARKLHVETLLEKRKERDARVEELKEQKKQERDDAAREKAEGVKSRLSALAAAAELSVGALRRRIRHKQDASRARLHTHLQAIRARATGPRPPTTSESQDPSSKEERELQENLERIEQERKEREKQKAIKKKARKLRQKLLATSNETILIDDHTFIDLNPHSSRIYKIIHSIEHLLTPLLNANDAPAPQDIEPIEKKRNKKKNKLTNGDIVVQESNNNREEGKGDGDSGRRKKKKGDKSDRPKLSKTSSVCSSLSDMSKSSVRTEAARSSLDMSSLERQLNELHRMIDKLVNEKSSVSKLHALKMLSQLMAIAAESDTPVLSTKSLCVCAMLCVRVCARCSLSAASVLRAAAAAHAAKLLSDQLEKDLQSDPKEMELAKQLADCLSVILDSVLCATRLYEGVQKQNTLLDDKKQHPVNKVDQHEVERLSMLRNRAHNLISYICLCGCITKAEKAGEAREGVQTLLTVCADLCHPCDVDVGPERASATQSIRCALGTGVCGSRAEFCMLFAQGAGLEHSGGFVRAARTAHLLRALAELDHQIVQDAFGEGGWPLEFRAAVARLLSQHAPSEKEAPRTTALRLSNQRLDQTLSEAMVLDLIVLVGFVVVNNPQLQETILDGWSVIKTLCTLPANWLVSGVHSHSLLPTLVALSEHPAAATAIASELSMGMLDEYMKSEEAQKIKLVQVIKQGKSKKGKK